MPEHDGAPVQRTHRALTTVLTHPDQKAQIVVPDGSRVILLVRGKSPSLAPIDEPGEYEVEAELLSRGRWPVAVIVVDLAHVLAWENMAPARVDKILDACAAALALTRGETNG